jgi:hypothetical protein
MPQAAAVAQWPTLRVDFALAKWHCPSVEMVTRGGRGSRGSRRESTPQRGPPSLRGGRRPFRQQVVQLAGWQRDMPSGGSSIIRR